MPETRPPQPDLPDEPVNSDDDMAIEAVDSLEIRGSREVTDVPSTQRNKADGSSPKEKCKCCKRCWTRFMEIVLHDAIYGSFVGPHPVAFLFLFSKCKGCCNISCVRPFSVASIATKVMYCLMLGFVTLLACFFIVPWPKTIFSHSSTSIAAFFPCQHDKMIRYKELNGGCYTHAGYFMVYRCFLAFATVMVTNSLIMIGVKSTRTSSLRAKIHHGFWLYKYCYLGGLLALYFLFLDGQNDKEGTFEFTCSVIGNVVHILFSLVELVFILDVIELWVIENRSGGGGWADFFYWTFTGVVSLISILIFVFVCKDFSMKQKFGEEVKWPQDNCVQGEKYEFDFLHLGLILACGGLTFLLIFATSLKRKFKNRFPYAGWLQVSVISLFNSLYLWSALYSSPHIHSRPRCNYAIPSTLTPSLGDPSSLSKHLQEGSLDVYFRNSGLLHGILAVLSILYYTFVHGPRSSSSPYSILYYYVFGTESKIPVFPDETDSPKEFEEAVEKFEVWDDEKGGVVYSWSVFYVVLGMGGLSLMMAMTNFTNPWATDMYNSSVVALACKFATTVLATVLYVGLLLIPSSKIDPEGNGIKDRMMGRLRNVVEGVKGVVGEIPSIVLEEEKESEGVDVQTV